MNKSLFDWFTETRFFTTQEDVFTRIFFWSNVSWNIFKFFIFSNIFFRRALYFLFDFIDIRFVFFLAYVFHHPLIGYFAILLFYPRCPYFAWFLLIPLLWSKTANCVLVYIPSYEKDSRFGQYFSSKLWNTSRFPLCLKPVRNGTSANNFGSNTTVFNAL